jgi:hypothetical protein
MIKLSNELKQVVLLVLIFAIIFRENIEIFISKKTYYVLYIILIINLYLLKNEPAIILLYSILFILIWYNHNMVY